MSRPAAAWAEPPTADHEDRRLRAVASLGVLDSGPQERFDRITRLVTRLLGVDAALINLVDDRAQRGVSASGTACDDLPRDDSLCAVVVDEDEPLVVPDLRADPRFRDYPAVAAGWRAYVGLPLHDLTGQPVGTLCVLDRGPRTLSEQDLDQLRSLAAWAESELNAELLHDRVALLTDAEQHLREVLDGAPAAVLLVEPGGAVTWGNRPARALFDRPLTGRALAEVLPTLQDHELGAGGRRTDDAVGSGGRRLLQAGLAADGRRFPAEVTVSLLPGSGGRRVVFVRDLSHELGEHEELARLQERTGVVLDALDEGVFVLDADGTTVFCNRAATRMLKRRATDLTGSDWHTGLHPDGCTTDPCPLADPLALAGRRLSPVWVVRRGAERLAVEVSVRMVRDGNGAAGLVVTLDDLTERLAVDRLKDEFISSVSHELRTPLTSIRGSLGLLAAGVVPADSEPGRRMVEVACQSADRLRRLVDDLLDLERMQAGQVELTLSPQQVGPLLVLATQSVAGLAADRGVLLEVQSSDLRVAADADRLVQVLVNLIGNAVKFSPAGSTVRLCSQLVPSPEGDRVQLQVCDSGRGIPPEQLERVFQRFAQVDGGDAREQSGTGLGLAIAQGLAEQHGGSLSVTSTVGVGSTFTLDLPLAPDRPGYRAGA